MLQWRHLQVSLTAPKPLAAVAAVVAAAAAKNSKRARIVTVSALSNEAWTELEDSTYAFTRSAAPYMPMPPSRSPLLLGGGGHVRLLFSEGEFRARSRGRS